MAKVSVTLESELVSEYRKQTLNAYTAYRLSMWISGLSIPVIIVMGYLFLYSDIFNDSAWIKYPIMLWLPLHWVASIVVISYLSDQYRSIEKLLLAQDMHPKTAQEIIEHRVSLHEKGFRVSASELDRYRHIVAVYNLDGSILHTLPPI